MKTRISIILILLAGVTLLLAATLTVDIPANDVPRVSEAFGSILGLGRNATIIEVQGATRKWIIDQTHDYERRKNTYTYSPTPMEMKPTPLPTAFGPAAAKAAETPKKKK